MARFLYCIALWLGSPLVWLRLLWRSRKQPEYLESIGERWGYYRQRPERPVIWVHAVSVGETRAAQPLVEALIAAYPDHCLLLTAMTPTGRAAGREVFGDRVVQAYLPYDYPGAVGRFCRHFAPRLGLLMETEVWPNLLAEAQRRKLPVGLVNARLSDRSARGYRKFGALARPAFSALAGAAAQTAADAARLGELGTPAVEVCGNLKFDVTPRPDLLELGRSWRQSLGKRRIWLAASTREGEEALVLAAHARLPGDVLLILVPRHPQRFDEVTRLAAEATGREPIRRSSGFPAPESRIWIGDSMGELAAYYAAADLAFVGGSLLPLGGQNLIEAAACGCPVVIGPHTFNFAQATADAVAAGAARQLGTAEELRAAVAELLDDPAALATMATAASSFAATHRGATQRTLALIERWRDREGRWPEPDRLPPGRPPRP